MSVPLIVQRVQFLLQDAGSEWTNTDYVCSALDIVNDDIEQDLQNLGLNFDTQVVILPNVPANTTSLSSYQADGGPLSGLVSVGRIEWRLAEQSQEDWQFVPPLDQVEDTDTGTGEPGSPVASDVQDVESWEWRNGVVQLSPCSQIVDLRVRYQSLPTVLNADSPNQPFRGLVNPLAYATCEVIEVTRHNGESASSMKFQKLKVKALATFRATQVQSQQAKVVRLGGRRTSPQGAEGLFRSPIT